jgi:hypothetical protein
MKNEHKIGVLVLMALSAIGAILVTRHYFFTQSQEPAGLIIQSISDTQETLYATYRIAYPRLAKEHEVFNVAIDAFIDGQKNVFLMQAEENWKARYNTQSPGESIPEKPSVDEKFPLIITWSQEQLNQRYVSIALEVYGFSGGAHGSTIIKTFNYDVLNKRMIRLSDLYPPQSDYLTVLSEHAISQLRQQQEDVNLDDLPDMIADGAGPREENFEAFTFSGDTVTLYFQQYQVGPYVIGIPKVTIPRVTK